jgi:hypothetical protein
MLVVEMAELGERLEPGPAVGRDRGSVADVRADVGRRDAVGSGSVEQAGDEARADSGRPEVRVGVDPLDPQRVPRDAHREVVATPCAARVELPVPSSADDFPACGRKELGGHQLGDVARNRPNGPVVDGRDEKRGPVHVGALGRTGERGEDREAILVGAGEHHVPTTDASVPSVRLLDRECQERRVVASGSAHVELTHTAIVGAT